MVDLGVCLCFKDSASYLAEWLAFYYTVGARRFYLYNNDSSDEYLPVILPYVDRGLVELKLWTGARQQSAMYQDCLDRHRDDVRWIAFMDDDEFVWPVVDPDLPTAMRRYEAHAGVAVCWFLYGSSHHEKRPNGLVMENYTWRTLPPLSAHFKCVVSPQRVVSPLYIGHAFNPAPSYNIVDEQGRVVTDSQTTTPSGDFLRVNHYVTKSMEELRARRSRPRADNGKVTEHSMEQWEQWAREWNQVEDLGILRFAEAVKQTMREFAPVAAI